MYGFQKYLKLVEYFTVYAKKCTYVCNVKICIFLKCHGTYTRIRPLHKKNVE